MTTPALIALEAAAHDAQAAYTRIVNVGGSRAECAAAAELASVTWKRFAEASGLPS